jgi:hypothetical protein
VGRRRSALSPVSVIAVGGIQFAKHQIICVRVATVMGCLRMALLMRSSDNFLNSDWYPRDVGIRFKRYIVGRACFQPENGGFHPYDKQTLWPLVRKRTIPTERPPLVDEI